MLNELFTLLIHPPSFSSDDLVLSREIFADVIKIGDYIRIVDPEESKSLNRDDISLNQSGLIFKLSNFQSGKLEVSLNKQVADPLCIKPYTQVTVEKVDPRQYEVDFVELTFKKQFLQRGNMWKFKKSMYGRPGKLSISIILS
jgi:hypothetical protein